MFSKNLKNHNGGVWLCGATVTDQNSYYFSANQLICLFNNQDNIYADLNLYDEGEYSVTAYFNRHSDCDVYVGYWYMDKGSFEPQICTVAQLFCNDTVTFIYKKTIKDRYYGSIVLFADPSACNIHNYVAKTFQNASLDLSFTSFPKSVVSPIVLTTDIGNKKINRYRIGNIILRGLTLPDKSVVCDKLELKSGTLLRFINPCVDMVLNPNTHPQDFILPIALNEHIDKQSLPHVNSRCIISSNVEIQLLPT